MQGFEYYIVMQSSDPTYCLIDKDADGVEEEWNLIEGIKMRSNFPDNTSYHMSKNNKGSKLTDFLVNTINLLMVSQKVKNLMEQEGITDVEFLHFTLYDKKDRIVNKDYFVANLIGTVDCLNIDESIFTRDSLEPDKIMIFEKVVLHTERILGDKKFFRLKERPTLHIIRSDFVAVLAKNNVTGIELLNLGEDVII